MKGQGVMEKINHGGCRTLSNYLAVTEHCHTEKNWVAFDESKQFMIVDLTC